MSNTRKKVLKEIELLPDDKLNEIYDFIHYFRIGLLSKRPKNKSIMNYSGIWKEMPEKDFNELIADIKNRRKSSFLTRRSFETGSD